jgi:hypothetical protein
MIGNPSQPPVAQFVSRLENLKDWPDKMLITEITALAEKYIQSAYDISHVIVSRLINPVTNSSFKLPMFYLVDSIMKNVGGPYAAFFGKQFSDTYVYALNDLHQKDKEKLAFLLTTWDERKLLPDDLLIRMRNQLENRQTQGRQNIPSNIQANAPAAISYNQPQAGSALMPQIEGVHISSVNTQMQQHPAGSSSSGLLAPAAAYLDLVKNEMINFLNQMYAEMNVQNTLSLDELALVNPSLFQQIRAKAEEKATSILATRTQSTMIMSSNNTLQPQQQQQQQQQSRQQQQQMPYGQQRQQ